MLKYTSIWLQ